MGNDALSLGDTWIIHRWCCFLNKHGVTRLLQKTWGDALLFGNALSLREEARGNEEYRYVWVNLRPSLRWNRGKKTHKSRRKTGCVKTRIWLWCAKIVSFTYYENLCLKKFETPFANAFGVVESCFSRPQTFTHLQTKLLQHLWLKSWNWLALKKLPQELANLPAVLQQKNADSLLIHTHRIHRWIVYLQ